MHPDPVWVAQTPRGRHPVPASGAGIRCQDQGLQGFTGEGLEVQNLQASSGLYRGTQAKARGCKPLGFHGLYRSLQEEAWISERRFQHYDWNIKGGL